MWKILAYSTKWWPDDMKLTCKNFLNTRKYNKWIFTHFKGNVEVFLLWHVDLNNESNKHIQVPQLVKQSVRFMVFYTIAMSSKNFDEKKKQSLKLKFRARGKLNTEIPLLLLLTRGAYFFHFTTTKGRRLLNYVTLPTKLYWPPQHIPLPNTNYY